MNSITERIDVVANIPTGYLVEHCPPPKSVKVELTASCDFKCFFCATAHGLRKKGHMDLDLFKRIATDIKDSGVEELGMFYLGESMLYPHLAEAVEFAKRELQFPYVFLTTNGRTATPDKLRLLFYSGLDSLKFSFNWADGKQMKEVTQVDAFDKVVENIKRAHAERNNVWSQTGHKCGLYASSILYEGAQRDLMEKAVADIKPYLDQHYYLPLFSQHMLVADDIEAKDYVPIGGNIGRVNGAVPPVPCWALFREGHVDFNGMVTGCCFAHTPEFDFGSLNEMSFMEAWNSPKAKEFRRAHLSGDVREIACHGCITYTRK